MNAPRLKIAHVCGYYAPGFGYQENLLPAAQARLGHDVHILTGDRYFPHPEYDTLYRPVLGPRHVGKGETTDGPVTLHRLPIRLEFKKRQNPVLGGLLGKIRALDPDVLHLHGITPLSTLSVMVSGASRRSTLVADHHLCRFNMEPYSTLKRVYYWTFRNIILPPIKSRVSAWLPINEDAERVLGQALGIRGDNISICRLGADISDLQPDPGAGAAWRTANGISADVPLIVHLGKLHERKDTHHLIAAFVAGAPEQARLVIAGEGDPAYMKRLRGLASGAADRVLFLPPLPHDQLKAVFNAADLGVWPGDAAVTLIEGMACGLPILMADEPGREYVGNCPEIDTISRGNVPALKAAFSSLAGSRPPASDRRLRIAAFTRSTLGWDVIAADSLATYRTAMSTRLRR